MESHPQSRNQPNLTIFNGEMTPSGGAGIMLLVLGELSGLHVKDLPILLPYHLKLHVSILYYGSYGSYGVGEPGEMIV